MLLRVSLQHGIFAINMVHGSVLPIKTLTSWTSHPLKYISSSASVPIELSSFSFAAMPLLNATTDRWLDQRLPSSHKLSVKSTVSQLGAVAPTLYALFVASFPASSPTNRATKYMYDAYSIDRSCHKRHRQKYALGGEGTTLTERSVTMSRTV